MADLGTDAGQTTVNATLNLSMKALDLLAKLLDKIFKAIANIPEQRRRHYEFKIAKSQYEREEALRAINNKTGFIEYDKLRKSGKEIINTHVTLSKKDMKLFAELAKREGVVFSGLKMIDPESKFLDKAKQGIHDTVTLNRDSEYELIILKEDLKKVEYIIERIELERRLSDIEEKINEYESKGVENLTEEEKDILEGLKAERAALKENVAREFNEKMTNSILREGAVYGEDGKLKGMDLKEALNRLTGYNLSKNDNGFSIIVDAKNPDNYIKVQGEDASFINEKREKIDYVKSTYEVFKDGKSVGVFNDERYVGRKEGYWKSVRESMDALLGNPKFFYKFNDEKVFKNWSIDVKRQNEQELNNKGIDDFKRELESKGFAFEENKVKLAHNEVAVDGTTIPKGTVIDKDFMTNAIGKGTSFVTPEQLLDFKEAFLIGESINSLEKLNILADQRDWKNSELEVATPEEREKLEKEKDTITKSIKEEEENIAAIKEERKVINAAQAERNAVNNKEKGEQQKDFTHDENREERDLKDQQHTMNEWKADINKTKAAKNKMETEAKANTHEHYSGEKFKAPEKTR